MPRSFLWIVPKSPVPPTDGARLASHSLIRGVLEQGADVHLVILPPADEAVLLDVTSLRRELPVSEVTVQPRVQFSAGGLLWMARSWVTRPRLPLTVASFAAPAVSLALESAIQASPAELTVYDGLHCAAHAYDRNGTIRSAKPYLLRAHNREAELWRRRSSLAAGLLERRLLSANQRAMARFEAAVVRHARGVATVSAVDRALFLAELPGLSPDRLEIVPIGREFGAPLPFPEADPWRLLFVGKLDWPPNREGLQWFLDAVWPAVIRDVPRWHLTIAGSGDGRWLARYQQLARVDVLGFVDDLATLYRRSSLVVVPLFFGSGTRVKALEAGRYGRPCLSTRVGMEGLGLSAKEHYLGAESVEEWIACLREVTTERLRETGQKAWQHLRTTHDLRGSASAFLGLAARAAGPSTLESTT